MSGAIDGIISGFNTTEMIDAILTYEKNKVTLIENQKANETNKLTTWKSVEAMLISLKSQASLLDDKKLWYAKSATSSDENIISVSSTTNATPGKYNLIVDQLASNHQIASQGMSSLSQSMGAGTIEIQVGNGTSTTITVDSSNNTLTALKDAINNSDAGVTAAIINDGSEQNPYRLILTANESGAINQISVDANLSGGVAPSFTAQFDNTEKLSWSDNATASPVRSTTAAYTGTENKTYTFTVGGTGEQTIGSGDIEINWTDGTNSGTITVSSINTDVALTGDGADGLSLYFSGGTVQAGDTFQIQAFAPTVQNGQDAIVRLGSTSGSGSPITFTSATNTISDLIEGVTLDLNQVSDGQSVEIKIAEDRDQIKAQIKQFITAYNEYQNFIDEQFTYNEESDTVGVLLGETSLMLLHNTIRTNITKSITGLPQEMRMLSQAGIKFNSSGELTFDESTFNDQIEENYTNLMNLFKSSGTSNNSHIEFISSTEMTKISTAGYDVDITQAATQGSYTGVSITNPADTPLTLNSTNNTIRLTLNNITSNDIRLDERTYSSGEDLAQEIEDKINGDSNLSGIGVEVEWVDQGSAGHLVIRSDTYGSTSKVDFDAVPSNSAHNILGLIDGTAETGQNVEGTINGEKATGTGQYLLGDNSNANTAGLKLLITLTPEDITEGSEGSVRFIKGMADILNDKITTYTDTYNGSLKAKKDTIEASIQTYTDKITFMEKQIERKRESLYEQFIAMENALSELQSQQQYLTAMINSLNSSSTSLLGNSNK
jgi:flagellar hook-associated protein 2